MFGFHQIQRELLGRSVTCHGNGARSDCRYIASSDREELLRVSRSKGDSGLVVRKVGQECYELFPGRRLEGVVGGEQDSIWCGDGEGVMEQGRVEHAGRGDPYILLQVFGDGSIEACDRGERSCTSRRGPQHQTARAAPCDTGTDALDAHLTGSRHSDAGLFTGTDVELGPCDVRRRHGASSGSDGLEHSRYHHRAALPRPCSTVRPRRRPNHGPDRRVAGPTRVM